jgi:hypothetical protein
LIVLVLLRDRRVGVAEIREGLQETLGHGPEPVVADLNTPLGSRDDGLDGAGVERRRRAMSCSPGSVQSISVRLRRERTSYSNE